MKPNPFSSSPELKLLLCSNADRFASHNLEDEKNSLCILLEGRSERCSFTVINRYAGYNPLYKRICIFIKYAILFDDCATAWFTFLLENGNFIHFTDRKEAKCAHFRTPTIWQCYAAATVDDRCTCKSFAMIMKPLIVWWIEWNSR